MDMSQSPPRVSPGIVRASLITSLAAVLAACGGGGSGSSGSANPPTASVQPNVAGAIQKGPFIVGSTVTINALANDGSNTSSTVTTQTTNDFGDFTFTEPAGTKVQISATGFYRNEITGTVSSNSITLRSVYAVTSASSQNAYVNALTHLTSGRVLELMKQGIAPQTAMDRAETEFLQQFSSVVPASGQNHFSSFSIYSNRGAAGSSYLLAVSAIAYQYAMDRARANGTNADAELSVFLNGLAADFAGDGIINMPLTPVRAAIPRIDPVAVMANVAAWIASQSGYSTVDINQHLDTDGDGVFNSVDTDDDNDGIADANDPSPYSLTIAPSLSGTPSTLVTAGSTYRFTPTLLNPDNVSVTFSGTNVPAWASVNSSTGMLSGTPQNVNVGTYSGISITATSAIGAVTLGPFTIRVAANPWQSLASFPVPVITATLAGDNGSIYAMAGVTTDSSIYGFGPITPQRYDIASNTWHALPQMNITRSMDATSHALGGKIYVIGGLAGAQELASVETFDIATNAWSAAAAMNTSRSLHASCVHNGMIYVFGGYTDEGDPNIYYSRATATVERYDPALNTWVNRSPMPELNWGMACATANDRIYVFGGNNTSSNTLNMYRVYNPLTDTWESSGTMPFVWGGQAAAVIDNEILVFGGDTNPTLQPLNVTKFDPSTSTWTTVTTLPVARMRFGATTWNNKIYLVGGEGSSPMSWTDEVWQYDPGVDTP
jgi:N-acetylneuraminic acid mutarotase